MNAFLKAGSAKKKGFGADLAGVLSNQGGLDALLGGSAPECQVSLKDIEVREQIRKEFDNEEHSIEGLANSLRDHEQIHPVILIPNDKEGSCAYVLIAGERRYRAAMLLGWTEIRARIRTNLSYAEARRIQRAENRHAKNLTQLEKALSLKETLEDECGGDVDALMQKEGIKSRGWLSKMFALLDLPEQASRLITENITDDIEVINNIRTAEKHDPEVARTAVDEMRDGDGNTRAKSIEAKEKAKSKSKSKPADAGAGKSKGTKATPRDTSSTEPSAVETVTPSNEVDAKGADAVGALGRAYVSIYEKSKQPKTVLGAMSASDQEAATEWLNVHFSAGNTVENLSRAVILGFRSGTFAADGPGAFALAAFLAGADSEVRGFNLLDILGAVKG